MKNRIRIGAVIITLNAERHIKGCLESAKWCDEIVVLDSGSEDKTIEIAGQYTDKIFREKWRGFGRQKQFAVDRSDADWVLSLDADERVSGKLKDEIFDSINKSGEICGYYIPRKNYFRGKWLRFGGQYPDYVLRLFRKSSGSFSADNVHEKVVVNGAAGRLINPIIHYAFEDITSRIEKMNRYSSLSALQMYNAGTRATGISPLSHFLSLFIKDYALRLGILDGAEGFNVALLKSLGAYYKYAKLLELQRNDVKD